MKMDKAKINKALQRLISVLPLKDNQDKCSTEIKRLHQAILRSFVENGRILKREEMSQYTSDVDNALAVLKKFDMVVCSAKGEAIGAYPFTMEKCEHAIQVNNHSVYAMCALDALAISPMFAMDTRIASQCRVTHDEINIKQSRQVITNLDEVGEVHFGIAWAAASEGGSCANSLCMEMIFLRDKAIAKQWLQEDSGNLDYREIFGLQQAVEFSARFFVPLLS